MGLGGGQVDSRGAREKDLEPARNPTMTSVRTMHPRQVKASAIAEGDYVRPMTSGLSNERERWPRGAQATRCGSKSKSGDMAKRFRIGRWLTLLMTRLS